jgi:hypothetical protein
VSYSHVIRTIRVERPSGDDEGEEDGGDEEGERHRARSRGRNRTPAACYRLGVQVRVSWLRYVPGSVSELAGEESVVVGVLLLSMTLTMAISIEF